MSPKRDFMITDPAHLLRQRTQKTSVSPTGPRRQSPSPQTPQYLTTTTTSQSITQNSQNSRSTNSIQYETRPEQRMPPSRQHSQTQSTEPMPLATRRQQLQQQQQQQQHQRNVVDHDADSLFSTYTARSSMRCSPNGLTIASSTLNDDTSSLVSSNTDTNTNTSANLAPSPILLTPTSPNSKQNDSEQNTPSLTSNTVITRRQSRTGSSVTPFGELLVQMKHNEDEQQVVVNIIKAKNLIARDANGFSDPYVKCYLLPGRE